MSLYSKIVPDSGKALYLWALCEEESFFTGSLTDAEREMVRHFQSEQRRRQFSCVRHLLQLAGISGKLEYDEQGKPKLSGKEISISHTNDFVGVYFSLSDKIGLDLEKIDKRILKISGRFMNEKEMSWYDKEDLQLLTLIWAAKEAVFKKHGGSTTFFASVQTVEKIDLVNRKLIVGIRKDDVQVKEELTYQIIDGTVLVYTT